ncbi:hypothetical protein [Mesorhizobium sp.]|uniref:virion core protein, T7 gp14 family n=1 Tax=Mesorhizobium sp. TaxID=1871066 RepID=UPI00258056FE|nr:hypothetical protein [Mesorhizobium sp.]
MAVAQFALSAASTVAGFVGQSQQAEAQQQYYENNRQAANRAAVNTYAANQNRALQERKAASREQQNLAAEAMRSRATAEVAAGEAGVTGLSVDALIADYYGQQGRYERTLDNNYQMQADYLRGEMDATQAQAEGRINSVQQGQRPSFADAAIRILGGGLDAYGGYQRAKAAGVA